MPISLRAAHAADLATIMAIERSAVAREFVGQWTEERHRTTHQGNDARYFVGETEKAR